MLLRRLKYPATTGLILRRTYPELYKSHIVKLFEEFPETRHWYNDQRKEMIFPNGSRLFFGSAEHEADMSAFYSAEFADIAPDEGQEFSQNELERLSASNRCTSNPNIVPKMVLSFMPGASATNLPPKGLSYLKRVFVDHDLKGEEEQQKWVFLQAFAWDNIEWARKDLERDGVSEEEFYSWDAQTRQDYFIERTEYGATLAALSDAYLRDAWLYGKWGVFQGQYFTNFNHERHTIGLVDAQGRPVPQPWTPAQLGIKPWYKKWLSGDWGFDHPTAIYWHAQDERGKVITYREMWAREMGEAEIGQEITERSGQRETGLLSFLLGCLRQIEQVHAKIHHGDDRRGHGGETSESRPRRATTEVPESPAGGLMHQMLDHDDWLIARNCTHLIECIPSLMRDDKNPEDVLKVDYPENNIGDDPADSARYGLQYMLGASYKPMQVRLEEKLKDIPLEGTGKYIAHLEFLKKERETGGGVFYPQRRKPRRH